jgi:hypothetical protein
MNKIAAAARRFEDFTGHKAAHVDKFDVADPDTFFLMGEAEAIAYNAVRDGKRESYIHEFRRKSRPLLTASHDGKSLYLLGGAYRVTDRGIEDSTMPAQIALVNPHRRPKMAKGRTAAQRAATRKLVALNRARRGGRPKVKARRRPAARVANPFHVTHRKRARKSNPWRGRWHYRRNPAGMPQGLVGDIIGVSLGGAGALGVDILIGMSGIAAIQTGIMRSVAKIAGISLVGFGLGMAKQKKLGEAVIAGGIAVTLYDLIKGFVVQSWPSVPLVPAATVVVPTGTTVATTSTGVSGMGWTSPATQMDEDGMGAYQVGAYVDDATDMDDGLGRMVASRLQGDPGRLQAYVKAY